MVLFVDAHAFFGFNCLVNTFAPSSAFKDSARKFIDNLYITRINDVVLIAAVELFSPKRHRQLVNKVLLHCVVQVVKTEFFFNFFDTSFSWNNNSLIFFYFVVNITLQETNNGRKLVIHVGGISNSTRNNEGRTCFVNQDAVYFVNNCEVVAALNLVIKRCSHVVAQIVKTEFVVGSVGDVTRIIHPLFCRRLATARNN